MVIRIPKFSKIANAEDKNPKDQKIWNFESSSPRIFEIFQKVYSLTNLPGSIYFLELFKPEFRGNLILKILGISLKNPQIGDKVFRGLKNCHLCFLAKFR